MDIATILLFETLVTAASLVSGLTGFGFALVLAPGLMLMLSPKTTVPIVALLSIFLNTLLFYNNRRFVEPGKVKPLIASGVVGMLAGTLLLIYINVAEVKMFTSVVIVVFALAFLMNLRVNVGDTGPATIAVGLISGFLGGSTSMSGPPVVLFFSNQGYDKMVFRANLLAYFLVLYTLTLPGYWVGGLLTWDVVTLSALALPGVVAGSLLGARLVHRINDRHFRVVVLLLVLLTGVVTLLTSVGGR